METSGEVTVYVTSEALTHFSKGYRMVLMRCGGGWLGLLSPEDLGRGKRMKGGWVSMKARPPN